MKNHNQVVGGIAGLIEAVLYLLGFAILFLVLQPALAGTESGLERLQVIIEHKTLYTTWLVLIYVLFGIVLIPLTAAIHEHFKKTPTIWTNITPVFGFIWSVLVIASGMIAVIGIESVAVTIVDNPDSALTSWQTIGAIQNGLGGGVEIIGGIWVFLVSITGLKYKVFSRFLNNMGLIVGGAGILTIVPPLKDLGVLFGLTQIVWFVWIGIAMIGKGR